MGAASGRGHVYPGEAVRRAMPTEKMEYAEFAREYQESAVHLGCFLWGMWESSWRTGGF